LCADRREKVVVYSVLHEFFVTKMRYPYRETRLKFALIQSTVERNRWPCGGLTVRLATEVICLSVYCVLCSTYRKSKFKALFSVTVFMVICLVHTFSTALAWFIPNEWEFISFSFARNTHLVLATSVVIRRTNRSLFWCARQCPLSQYCRGSPGVLFS